MAWSDPQAEARITGASSEPAVEPEAAPESFATGVAPVDAVLGASPRLALRAALVDPRHLVTPLLRGGSGTCDADRRRDPAPIHTYQDSQRSVSENELLESAGHCPREEEDLYSQ